MQAGQTEGCVCLLCALAHTRHNMTPPSLISATKQLLETLATGQSAAHLLLINRLAAGTGEEGAAGAPGAPGAPGVPGALFCTLLLLRTQSAALQSQRCGRVELE